MSLSSRFGQDLYRYLDSNVTSYNWEHELLIGGPTRERVDVGGEPRHGQSKGCLPILIEAELKREDPVGNILKIWTRLNGGYPKGLILIQGFSKVYRSRKYSNRRIKAIVAIKFGKMIQRSSRRKFRYIPIEIPYYPRAGRTEGDGARETWARWFGQEIASHLRRLHIPLKETRN